MERSPSLSIALVKVFQSLVGFKINWNLKAEGFGAVTLTVFQSLVGFKINWNINPLGFIIVKLLFQSLVGFKINWNPPQSFPSVPKPCFNP